MRSQSYFTDPIINRCFKANNSPITSVLFSPDMKQCISGTETGDIFVWNFKPQMRPYKFSGHKNQIADLAINPAGNLIASASLDETVRLWSNTVKGKCQVLKCHPAPTRSVDFSSNGNLLLTGSNDKTMKIFNLSGLQNNFPKVKFNSSFTGHTNWVKCARFSPDDRLIGSCGDDHTVRIFDVEQKSNVITFLDHLQNVNSCKFSPDGTIIASAGDDAKIKLFDIRSRRLIQHYDAHAMKINEISFHPSGNYLLSCSDDSNIKIWDLKMGQILYTVHGHSGKINSVKFSDEGDHFCSGGDDSILMVWKSNIGSDEEEFKTLGLGTLQKVKVSNKTKINVEESKELKDPNNNTGSLKANKTLTKSQPGTLQSKAKTSTGKAFGMKYKVTLEKGVNDLYNKTPLNNQEENLKAASMLNNCNTFTNMNPIMDSTGNLGNISSANPFSRLPPELATSFDKMISQLDLVTKTMKIMDKRIQIIESQVEGLYGMRKLGDSQELQGTINTNKMFYNTNNNVFNNQEIEEKEIKIENQENPENQENQENGEVQEENVEINNPPVEIFEDMVDHIDEINPENEENNNK